ncbi:uncharacterized protein LOC132193751 [Neocloeon triangulifer]|uniref:uncharacterized protein LOC132193751 n=1 Tax=Neocloeon triangulifer TaxID=2078957 RepID=UPI00286EFE66|nr:uncharacterized protein LOC132193751 [Neocloeon triangulifer]
MDSYDKLGDKRPAMGAARASSRCKTFMIFFFVIVGAILMIALNILQSRETLLEDSPLSDHLLRSIMAEIFNSNNNDSAEQSQTSNLTAVITEPTLSVGKINESTCSQKATNRGPHQRVVSFSYYGGITSKRGYFSGIEENAKLIQKIYPNWTMRVYHDIKDEGRFHQILDDLEQKFGKVLDLCFVGNLPIFGNILGTQQNMWRFLSLADPLVDKSLFRDLDSSLNEREASAVQEWLNSTYPLHVMRDHPYHYHPPILAGMWGAQLDLGHRDLWKEALRKMMEMGKVAGNKGLDQGALQAVVWPLTKTKGFLLQHDSFTCDKGEFIVAGEVRHFPKCRTPKVGGNFVGSRKGVDTKPITEPCPKKCRARERCVQC